MEELTGIIAQSGTDPKIFHMRKSAHLKLFSVLHFGQIADHGHTAAGIAIGIAGAIALIKILKDRKNISEVGDDEEIQEEIQEVS